MGYIEKFIGILLIHSKANNYQEAIKEWTHYGECYEEKSQCICGHPILENCIVRNLENNNELVIGNCCLKKFGIKKEHYNKTKRSYLEYALTKVTSEGAETFIRDMLESLTRYSLLKMSEKQKIWLEAIAGKPYRWKYKWDQ